MKSFLRSICWGLITLTVSWLVVLITDSGFGPCGPSGPFWWLFIPLILPGGAIVEALGIESDWIAISVSGLIYALITGLILEATIQLVKKKRRRPNQPPVPTRTV